MPYVPYEFRKSLDPHIDELAKAIVNEGRGDESALAGLLNYSITRLILKVIMLRFVRIRYSTIAMVSGVISNVSSEFYRRIAAPYEAMQATANGDVDLMKQFDAMIDNP